MECCTDSAITLMTGQFQRRVTRQNRKTIPGLPRFEDEKTTNTLGKGAKQERELGELSKSEALKLARNLYRLGAVRIWATNIELDEDGAQYSKRLLIALPDASPKRSKIYELCADHARPFIGGSAPAIRVGKTFMRVSLM
jgi:hypothetical protein